MGKLFMTFTEDHTRKLFDRLLKENLPNREHLIEYLTYVITDRYQAVDELMVVALDLMPDLDFAVGDTVYVNREKSYIGTIDLDLMKENDQVLETDDRYIKGIVSQIKPYKFHPYKIKFKLYTTPGATPDDVMRDVDVSHIYIEKTIPGPGRLNVGDLI